MSSSPATLSDADLVEPVRRLLDRCNAAETEFIVHLGEVDARPRPPAAGRSFERGYGAELWMDRRR